MSYWILFVCNLSIGCLTQEFAVAKDCTAAKEHVIAVLEDFKMRRPQVYCERFER